MPTFSAADDSEGNLQNNILDYLSRKKSLKSGLEVFILNCSLKKMLNYFYAAQTQR